MAAHPKGFFGEVGGWIKRHPLASALIAIVAGVIIYAIITNSQAQTGNPMGNVAPNTYPDIYIIGSIGSPGPTQPTPPGKPIPPVIPPPKPPVKPPKKLKGKPIIHRGGGPQKMPPERRPPIDIQRVWYGYDPTKAGPHPR